MVWADYASQHLSLAFCSVSALCLGSGSGDRTWIFCSKIIKATFFFHLENGRDNSIAINCQSRWSSCLKSPWSAPRCGWSWSMPGVVSGQWSAVVTSSSDPLCLAVRPLVRNQLRIIALNRSVLFAARSLK
ncbi:hypothetical protein BDW75DRAFT_224725 [Aspergillus navahoensis]